MRVPGEWSAGRGERRVEVSGVSRSLHASSRFSKGTGTCFRRFLTRGTSTPPNSVKAHTSGTSCCRSDPPPQSRPEGAIGATRACTVRKINIRAGWRISVWTVSGLFWPIAERRGRCSWERSTFCPVAVGSRNDRGDGHQPVTAGHARRARRARRGGVKRGEGLVVKSRPR